MLNGAIIGIGKIAQESHMPAYMSDSLSNKVKIIAAVDPDQRSWYEAKKKFPDLRFYSSLNELFENEKPDFIDICTPPFLHFKLMLEGIKNHVHILCEKPFAVNMQETEKLYEALCKSDYIFYPCHQYKYSPVWLQFKTFLDEIDNEDSFFAQFNIYRMHADPGLKALNYYWRINPKLSGGGIMSDIGFHYLYLALWFMGNPGLVSARTFQLVHKDYDVEDTAAILLENTKGVIQINLTWGAYQRLNNANIICPKGSLLYHDNQIVINSDLYSKEIPMFDASDKSSYTKMYEKLISDFTDTIELGNNDKSGIEESYQTTKLLNTCYKSAMLNQSISFP